MELLISLSLMGILLVTIFGFFMQTKKTEARFLKAKEIVTAREHIQVKLSHALFQLVPLEKIYKSVKEKKPALYLDSENTLCMYFDNGIDPEPRLSGPVLGKLKLNDKKELILSISSLGEEPISRMEVLQRNISKLSFEFLGRGEKKAHQNQKPRPSLHPNWPVEKLEVPSMLAVHIQVQNSASNSFAFPLSSFDAPITYYEGVK